MKKKINKHLAASLFVIFLLYLLLGQVTQIFVLQRYRFKETQGIIRQMDELTQDERVRLWDTVYALAAKNSDMMVLSAYASEGVVFRSTDETLAGRTLSDLGVPSKVYERSGKASCVIINSRVYYGMFYTQDGVIYGRFQDVMDTVRFLTSSLVILAAAAFVILVVFTARTRQYVGTYIEGPLSEMVKLLGRFSRGDMKVEFPIRKNDLPEIQDIYACMERTKEQMVELTIRQEQQEQLLAMETERADAANAAKQVFLSKISHDIRTPVNGILGMAAVAEAHIDDRERVKDALGKIDDSGKQLLAMLGNVLDMSRIESGRVDLREEEFQLADLINETIEQLRPLADERNHQLTVEVRDLVHEHVLGSPRRVADIFTHMIENAVKYTPRGGKIRVTISEAASQVRYMGKYVFLFEDNGIGMSEETVARIFEPFERADDSRAAEVQGMGLGLSIAKNLVQLMNGSIQVESEPNKGSKFTVTIWLKLQKRATGAATHMEQKNICKKEHTMKDELWDIYDENKNLTGRTMRRNDWNMQPGDYHLTVLGVIRHTDGRYLITKRVKTKSWAPGWWEVTGGGVMAGESSRAAVLREVREETGLDVSDPEKWQGGYVFSYRRDNPEEKDNYFVDVYCFQGEFSEGDLHLQADETDGFMLADAQQIQAFAEEGIFLHYDSIKQIFTEE